MITPQEVRDVVAISFRADNEHILIDRTNSVELGNPNLVKVWTEVAVDDIASVETSTSPGQLRQIDPIFPDPDTSVSFNVFQSNKNCCTPRMILWVYNLISEIEQIA